MKNTQFTRIVSFFLCLTMLAIIPPVAFADDGFQEEILAEDDGFIENAESEYLIESNPSVEEEEEVIFFDDGNTEDLTESETYLVEDFFWNEESAFNSSLDETVIYETAGELTSVVFTYSPDVGMVTVSRGLEEFYPDRDGIFWLSPGDYAYQYEDESGTYESVYGEFSVTDTQPLEIPLILDLKKQQLYFSAKVVNPIYSDIFTEEDLLDPIVSNLAPEDSFMGPMFTMQAQNIGSENNLFLGAPEAVSSFWSTADAGDYVRDKMLNRISDVEFNFYSTLPPEDSTSFGATVSEIWDTALRHTGEAEAGDYLRFSTIGYSYSGSIEYSGTDEVYCYNVALTFTYCADYEQERVVTEEVTRVLDSLSLGGKTQYQIAKTIYDYLTANVTYDYTNLNNDDYTLKYSAYAALVDKTAVCQGFANALYRLLMTAGVDTRIISSKAMGHAWNIIQMGGCYYAADATWDINYSPDNYQFFLRGRDYWLSNHLCQGISEIGDQFSDAAFSASYPLPASDYDISGEQTSYTGLLYSEESGWQYYQNGVFNDRYTGFAYREDIGWWYVENGRITFTYTGLAYSENVGWRYVENSQITFTYSGLAYDEAVGWVYCESSTIKSDYTGLIYCGGFDWWYVENGRITFTYTGLAYREDIGWWYVENSRITYTYTGLAYREDIGWWYVENSQITFTYTGLAYNEDIGWVYCEDSSINWQYTGLAYREDIGWWYVENGQITFTYTGLAYREDIGWWYVENSQITFTYTGPAYNETTGWVYCENSTIKWDYTGLAYCGGFNWWYVENGQVTFTYTGLVYREDIGWWYVDNGRITYTYTGLAYREDIGWWYVENSQITFTYTGTWKENGEIYQIENSRVTSVSG